MKRNFIDRRFIDSCGEDVPLPVQVAYQIDLI
jgi:hypothetical protein